MYVKELLVPVYAFPKFHYAHKRISKLIDRCVIIFLINESVNIKPKYDYEESVLISLVAETENQIASLFKIITEAVKKTGCETDSIKESDQFVDLLKNVLSSSMSLQSPLSFENSG